MKVGFDHSENIFFKTSSNYHIKEEVWETSNAQKLLLNS